MSDLHKFAWSVYLSVALVRLAMRLAGMFSTTAQESVTFEELMEVSELAHSITGYSLLALEVFYCLTR